MKISTVKLVMQPAAANHVLMAS